MQLTSGHWPKTTFETSFHTLRTVHRNQRWTHGCTKVPNQEKLPKLLLLMTWMQHTILTTSLPLKKCHQPRKDQSQTPPQMACHPTTDTPSMAIAAGKCLGKGKISSWDFDFTSFALNSPLILRPQVGFIGSYCWKLYVQENCYACTKVFKGNLMRVSDRFRNLTVGWGQGAIHHQSTSYGGEEIQT